MDVRKAFDAIQRKVKADPRRRVIESFFDKDAFGNFWIAYEEDGARLSVVNDRGQLILYEGAAGEKLHATLLSDLPNADEKAVLDSIS